MNFARTLSLLCFMGMLIAFGSCAGPEGPRDVGGSSEDSPDSDASASQTNNGMSEETAVGAAEEGVVQGPPLSEGVVLELEVEISPQKQATVSGRTNLPDGTIIMTSVSGQSTEFLGQDRTTVDNGSFRAGPFGPASGLKDGIYTAGATMPIPRVQDPKVRAIIGDEGENLVGSLVKRGDLGTTISLEEEFQVGSDSGVTAERERRRETLAKAQAIFSDLRELEAAGRKMEELREPDNLERLRRCGEQMRQNQALAETLRSRAEALPRSVGVHLAIAATSMNLCVSCLETALQSCDIAAASLADAEIAISNEAS